ncbi:MAG: glycosyltransferase family 52 [Pelistega sp.]|nr:glycosyltransferase family 52 [Pelistega sp.]
MTQNNNLFICFTPLQILIARKIIEQDRCDNVSFIVFYYLKTKKFDHYINLLRKDYPVKDFQIKSTTKLQRFADLLSWKKYLQEHDFHVDSIYLASIDNPFVLISLSNIQFNKLYTFDDGLANLNYKGVYYIYRENSFQKLMKILLGIRWDIKKIKNNLLSHYTIYPDQRNISNRIMNLFLQRVVSSDSKLPKLKVFVGQPLGPIDKYFSVYYLNEVLRKLDVDYYIPHPREEYNLYKTKYLDSDLIIEDLYLELSKKYNVVFYTFFSTALINIKMMDSNCTMYFVYDDYLMNKYSELYAIFKRANIKGHLLHS